MEAHCWDLWRQGRQADRQAWPAAAGKSQNKRGREETRERGRDLERERERFVQVFRELLSTFIILH